MSLLISSTVFGKIENRRGFIFHKPGMTLGEMILNY